MFIQYLVGLAVTEACREIMGQEIGARVRLKWPNDVYVVGGGRGQEEKREKIGGILVSTNFSDGKVDIIVGAYLPSDTSVDCISERECSLDDRCWSECPECPTNYLTRAAIECFNHSHLQTAHDGTYARCDHGHIRSNVGEIHIQSRLVRTVLGLVP